MMATKRKQTKGWKNSFFTPWSNWYCWTNLARRRGGEHMLEQGRPGLHEKPFLPWRQNTSPLAPSPTPPPFKSVGPTAGITKNKRKEDRVPPKRRQKKLLYNIEISSGLSWAAITMVGASLFNGFKEKGIFSVLSFVVSFPVLPRGAFRRVLMAHPRVLSSRQRYPGSKAFRRGYLAWAMTRTPLNLLRGIRTMACGGEGL